MHIINNVVVTIGFHNFFNTPFKEMVEKTGSNVLFIVAKNNERNLLVGSGVKLIHGKHKYHQLQYINLVCKDVLVYRHLAIINKTNKTKDIIIDKEFTIQ